MRIKESDLENMVKRLNSAAGHGENPPRDKKGIYRLGAAYGGYRIERVVNESGAINDLSGYGNKKETYIFLRGLVAQENA